MKKVYFLGTCSTCKRIMKGLNLKGFELQDIKLTPIIPLQLDQMKALSGSFESLFSRRAVKYKAMNLAEKNLSENDYRRLILEEYTFLKRPVFMVNHQIFIGSAPKTIAALQQLVGAKPE